MTPTVLDLFSGIGGFALAFEAAGFRTAAFSEIEPYPCKVLAQHWPDVPNLGDVRGIDAESMRGTVDVVCGGFPCQDISTAGKGAGIEGARSGLWFEMLRIIRGSQPSFCLIENVPALRSRGADVVLEGLETTGYTARAFVVGAGNAGAPHQRARAWMVAYRKSERERGEIGNFCEANGRSRGTLLRQFDGSNSKNGILDPNSNLQGSQDFQGSESPSETHGRRITHNPNWWATEPAMDRMVSGLPNRAHRIKALGNSIVPQVAYPFAKFIYTQLAEPQGAAGKAGDD